MSECELISYLRLRSITDYLVFETFQSIHKLSERARVGECVSERHRLQEVRERETLVRHSEGERDSERERERERERREREREGERERKRFKERHSENMYMRE